jgi:hypothetical protein
MIAGTQLGTAADLDLTIDGHVAVLDQELRFATRADDPRQLEQGSEADELGRELNRRIDGGTPDRCTRIAWQHRRWDDRQRADGICLGLGTRVKLTAAEP